MTDDDTRALVCYRIADAPTPRARSFKANCDACGAAIWVAYSSPPTDERRCFQCVPWDEAKFERVTNAQLADVMAIAKHRKPSS